MYYATTDSRGERILDYAEIAKCWTYDGARDYLLDSFAEVEEGFEIRIVFGHFDDCWKKTDREPQRGDVVISPFTWEDVTISDRRRRAPGVRYRSTFGCGGCDCRGRTHQLGHSP